MACIQASLAIIIPGKPDGVYDIDPLARSIDVKKSSYRVGKVKIDLTLAKAEPGIAWKELDGMDEEASGSKPAVMKCESIVLKEEGVYIEVAACCLLSAGSEYSVRRQGVSVFISQEDKLGCIGCRSNQGRRKYEQVIRPQCRW